MNFRVLTAVLCLASSAGCYAPGADAAPEIVVDRTACSHCGMLVSEPIYAAAYKAAGAEARVFDDLGCLRDAARKDGRLEGGRLEDAKVWVHDAVTGSWIDGETAAFVTARAIRTPMGGGTLAYRDAADASRAAAMHRTRTCTLASFMSDGSRP